MRDLDGKSILLAVTGGIAAYKAAMVASLLVRAGAGVDVVMTEAAQRFIQPLSFSAITQRPVHTDPFAAWHDDFTGHVGLAKNTDLLLVAPATAASIARLALGLADDMLGLIALSTAAPIVLAPAMEEGMLHHPSTQSTPHGPLPSAALQSWIRSMDDWPQEPSAKAAWHLQNRSWPPPEMCCGDRHGWPVRRLSLPRGARASHLIPSDTSGIAPAAPWDTRLRRRRRRPAPKSRSFPGETTLLPPNGAALVHVNTAIEMHHAVEQATVGADVLIMAAAVADFRPETSSRRKLKKTADQEYLDIRLVRNPDILASIDRPNLLKVGFAAETDDHLENAARKLEAKGLAMIVANDAEATIGASSSTATILTANGEVTALPMMSKEALATEIIAMVAGLLDRAKSPHSMIYQGRSSRSAANIARSQLAVRLGIAVYAAICCAVALRCTVLTLALPASVWSVGTILSVSSPLIVPLTVVPPANRVVVGAVTLSDLTAMLLLLALPLALVGRRQRP